MSIANVFHTQKLSTSGGGSGSITSTGVDTTGSTIILVSVCSFGGTTTTISDSQGNTWTALPTQTGGSSTQLQMWYCISPTTNASHTFTYAGNSGCFPAMEVVGWSGVDTLFPFDFFKTDAGTSSSTTHTAGALAPGIDNSLLISVMAFNNANFTSIDSSFSTYDPHNHDASTVGIVFGYQIQTTATSRTPTFTVNTSNSQYAITSFVLIGPASNPPVLLSHTLKQSTNSNDATTSAIDTRGASAIFVLAAVDSSSSEVITDSQSNTWTARTDFNNGANHVRLFYCLSPSTNASHTFTVTQTGAKPSICVAAFSGILTASAFDVENSGGNNTGNVTPTALFDLIVTGLSTTNTLTSPLTVDSTFRLLDSAIGTSNAKGIGFAYKIQPSQAATSTNWNANDAARVSNITAFFKDNSVTLTVSANDALSFSDSLDQIGYGNILSDSLSLSDLLSINAPLLGISLSDTLALSDFASLTFSMMLSESFTLSDLLDYGLSIPVSITGDALSLSDATAFMIGVGLGKSDTLTFSDVLRIATDVRRMLGDTILLSDFVVALLAGFPIYSDNFTLSDSAQLALSLGISSNDSLSLSDALQIALVNNLILQKSDSLALSDSVTVSMSGPLDQYIRHWLNDVPR